MSSTTATRKPPVSSNANRRSQPPSSARPDNRSPTPSSAATPAPTHGLARRNTVREGGHRSSGSISSTLSARSAVKTRPLSQDDTELETAAIVEDLRNRLVKSESAAEAAAEEFTKQIKALQIRLDEAQADYVRVEDSMHAKDEIIEGLEVQVKDLTRTKRDQENIYEAERTAAQQEKEELLDREEELNTIIQRLKDTLSLRQPTPSGEARNSMDTNLDESSVTFAPSTHSLAPQNSLLLQKDKLIESLRLELAESQVLLAEADHLEGTKLQQLEQQLLEVRMTNARLMEDNESFQLLLSSAALNGDFPRGDYLSNAFSDTDPEPEPETHAVKKVQGSPRNSMAMGLNLAEELNEADHDDDSERIRKLESELKQLKDQNKAMSLYINNIIERILQHKDSEAILDKTSLTSPMATSTTSTANTDKPLPPKPDEEPHTAILQRTKSLAGRKPQSKPEASGIQRSQSLNGQLSSHKRSKSDAANNVVYSAGSVVNNIYRGEGMITPRANTFYGGVTGEHYTRSSKPRDSSASVDSGVSDAGCTEASSVPSPPHPPTPMGPIAGNKLRPLTLVQKNVSNGMMSPPLGSRISGDYMDGSDDPKQERRQSKRSSWMGWFNRGKEESAPSVVAESVFEGKDVE